MSVDLLGIIADHPTPKISEGGVSFTLNSRDYKGVITVVVSENDRNTEPRSAPWFLQRTGCLQRDVGDGE